MEDIDLDKLLEQYGLTPAVAHRFAIEPGMGIGPIRFGMHKDEVARVFTYAYTSFFKTPESSTRSDMCEAVGLIIHYGPDLRVVHIETMPPRHGVRHLELFGHDVTDTTVEALVRLVTTVSALHERHEYGYDFPELGLRTFNTHFASNGEAVESFGLSMKAACAAAGGKAP